MHVAVLANLELGEVKAECFRLPDQVLQLAVCLSGRAGARQRALNAAEVGDEFGRRSISTAVAGPSCRTKPVGDVEQELSVLLRRRALLELSPTFGIDGTQSLELATQMRAQRGGGGVSGESPADARGRGLERKQHVVGLDEHRFGC